MGTTDKNARFWDKIARKYAADPIADMAGYEATLERTRHFLNAGDRVIEFGCGTGSTALRLAPHLGSIVATDISGEMIAIAREKAQAAGCTNATFEVGEPEGLAGSPINNADGFDVALAFNLLHLVKDRRHCLAAIATALKPGGLFISKTPCLTEMSIFIRAAIPLAQLIGKAPYVDVFSAATLEKDIEDAGFDIVERGRHGKKGKDFRLFVVARRS